MPFTTSTTARTGRPYLPKTRRLPRILLHSGGSAGAVPNADAVVLRDAKPLAPGALAGRARFNFYVHALGDQYACSAISPALWPHAEPGISIRTAFSNPSARTMRGVLAVMRYVEAIRWPPSLMQRAEDWEWSSLRVRLDGDEAELARARPVAAARGLADATSTRTRPKDIRGDSAAVRAQKTRPRAKCERPFATRDS